jgi:hypothetical protein
LSFSEGCRSTRLGITQDAVKRIGKTDDKLGPTVSRKRACELLGGIRPATLRTWERKGKITGHRLTGTFIVYKLADIQTLLGDAATASLGTFPLPPAAAAHGKDPEPPKPKRGKRQHEPLAKAA